ncbi:MAG: uroporphyrinogen-III synthase [Gemmatimonadota bacterium]
MSATVYLVGCGPGDPRLLTVRAADVLARATAVVHGPDIARAILDLCPEGARLTAIGAGEAAVESLTEHVGEHERVARLYPGDPLLQSACIVESAALRSRGISFEVIPGISRGFGAATCSGIPLGGEDGGRAVVLVRRSDEQTLSSAAALTLEGATILIEADPATARRVLVGLVDAGCQPDLPVAIIRRGSEPAQGTEISTLAEIARAGQLAGHPDQLVVAVGRAVALRDSDSWFEGRPLAGKRIIVTRPRAQAGRLAVGLEELGAEVLTMPTIRITAPSDPDRLRAAACEPDRYDWVIFTSVNGVAHFWEALREAGLDTRALAGVSLCAIGAATAAAVEMEGARVDLMPKEYLAESVIAALAEETDLRGSRVLLPRAEVAREVLPDTLRELGAVVDDVPAYRTVPDTSAAERLQLAIGSGTIDLVTFTSSSSARNFAELAGGDLHGAEVASIGPITSATVRELGWPVAVEAAVHTIDGLLEAIRRSYSGPSGG